MIEDEWLGCTDPSPMLHFLWHKASDRKLRLFAVACCEHSRQLLRSKSHRAALEISTRFADGEATEEELRQAYQRSNDYACSLYSTSTAEREIRRWAEATAVANATAITTTIYKMAGHAADAAWMIHRASHRNPNRRLADLLREICGNPFRRIVVDSSWLTSTVLALSQSIYRDRAFDRMPILADALEDAGCQDAEILAHCRGPGPHVRGCWLVDALTGRT